MTGAEKTPRLDRSSLKDLRLFPDDVKDLMGFALLEAQEGRRHRSTKILNGFGGSSVLEIVDDHDGDAYRAVYSVQFESHVYVLHAFQKKSKRGIRTPKTELDLIVSRLKAAQQDHEERRRKTR